MVDDQKKIRRPLFLTQKVAYRAIETVWREVVETTPALAHAFAFIAVVVPVREGHLGGSVVQGDALRVIPDLLYCGSVGDRTVETKFPLREIALSKATQKWTEHLLGIQSAASEHLFMEDDTVYRGAVVHKGIVVACSGFEEDQDEELSKMIACRLVDLAGIEYLKWRRKEGNQHKDFIIK